MLGGGTEKSNYLSTKGTRVPGHRGISTVWTPQRYSRSYREKRKGRKETKLARRIKGGVKRRETDLASNQFPKCSPPSKTHREIHRVG